MYKHVCVGIVCGKNVGFTTLMTKFAKLCEKKPPTDMFRFIPLTRETETDYVFSPDGVFYPEPHCLPVIDKICVIYTPGEEIPSVPERYQHIPRLYIMTKSDMFKGEPHNADLMITTKKESTILTAYKKILKA